MTKIFACLLGDWVCLNDDENCIIGGDHKSPSVWWEEHAPVYAPLERDPKRKDSLYGLDYVNIHYKNKNYRINPLFIQIVTE